VARKREADLELHNRLQQLRLQQFETEYHYLKKQLEEQQSHHNRLVELINKQYLFSQEDVKRLSAEKEQEKRMREAAERDKENIEKKFNDIIRRISQLNPVNCKQEILKLTDTIISNSGGPHITNSSGKGNYNHIGQSSTTSNGNSPTQSRDLTPSTTPTLITPTTPTATPSITSTPTLRGETLNSSFSAVSGGGVPAVDVAGSGSSERLDPFKVKEDFDAVRKGLRSVQRSVNMPVDFTFISSNYH